MLAHALEFAPGTAEDCKKVILGMFDPQFLLRAYWIARREHGTHDIAILCPNPHDPNDLFAGPRVSLRALLKELRYPGGDLPSAHLEMKLPADSAAFWVVARVPKFDLPATAILFSTPYEQVIGDTPMIGEA